MKLFICEYENMIKGCTRDCESIVVKI